MPNNYFVTWEDKTGTLHSEDVYDAESGIGMDVLLRKKHPELKRVIKVVRYPSLYEIRNKMEEWARSEDEGI